jgi:hypothetical protein
VEETTRLWPSWAAGTGLAAGTNGLHGESRHGWSAERWGSIWQKLMIGDDADGEGGRSNQERERCVDAKVS